MLDVLLALDGKRGRIVLFKIDELFQSVAFCESRNRALAMLINAPDKIVRHADV
jgi:hypothetical protein